MASTQADFTEVALNTDEESSCSPHVDDQFRGIAIVAPTEIKLSGDTVFPVCGTLQASARYLHQFQSIGNEIVVVAVNAGTHESYASNLLDEGFDPEPDHGLDPSTEGFDTAVLTEWFNVDLFYYIEELPLQRARYYVFAYLGELVSNVVVVDIVGEGPAEAASRSGPMGSP